MLVKELIEELKKMPQEKEVYVGAKYEYLDVDAVGIDNNEIDVSLYGEDPEEWVTIYTDHL